MEDKLKSTLDDIQIIALKALNASGDEWDSQTAEDFGRALVEIEALARNR